MNNNGPPKHRFLGRTEPGEGAGITGAKRGGRMLKHETDERQSLWFQRRAWRREAKESVQDRFVVDIQNASR